MKRKKAKIRVIGHVYHRKQGKKKESTTEKAKHLASTAIHHQQGRAPPRVSNKSQGPKSSMEGR